MLFMMAANDLQTDYQMLGLLDSIKSRDTEEFVQGAKFYALRLLFGHLRETFKLVERASKSTPLMQSINKSEPAKAAFSRLMTLWDKQNAPRQEDFRMIKGIRDKASFHYDDNTGKLDEMIEEALQGLSQNKSHLAKVVHIDDPRLTRFVIADDVIDVAMFESILEIADGGERQEELKKRNEMMGELVSDFMQVCRAVTNGFVNDHALR